MNRFIWFFLALIFMTGCSNKHTNSYTIDGSIDIDSLNGKWVYMVPSFHDYDMVLDSSLIENNQFHMSGNVGYSSHVALLIVADKDHQIVAPLTGANIVVEEGDIVVKFDKDRIPTIGGTPQNELIQHCDDVITSYNDFCDQLTLSTLPHRQKIDKLRAARNQRNEELVKLFEKNINTEKMQMLFLEYYLFFTKKDLERIESKMDDNTRSNSQIAAALSSKTVALGEKYINFELPDQSGHMVQLKDVVGTSDYVFVTFWASWCAPCLREIHELENCYSKCNSYTMKVVGVSLDTDSVDWKNSIVNNDFNFIQLNDQLSWASPLVAKYGVNYLPHSFVVNRDGVIVSKNTTIAEFNVLVGY